MSRRCRELLALALCLVGLASSHAAAPKFAPKFSCFAIGCQTCQTSRPYQCSVCKPGYEKTRSNVCVPCTKKGQTSAACLTYAVANACACKVCKPGFGPNPNLSGQCLPCAVDGCSKFSAGCTCSVCKQGYTSDGSGGCTKCTDAGQTLKECVAFQEGTCTCTRCKPGFSLDAGTGTCTACADDQSAEVCKTYTLNTCTCTACKPGYGPVTAGACPPCANPAPGDECAAYGSVPGQRGVPALGSCACAVCASGYARINTGDCLQCTAEGQNTDACLGFERNSCKCTQCAAHYGPLTRDKRCPPNTCDDAHDATVCKSYKYGVPCFCTACNPGYTLSVGACLPCTDPARDTECLTYSPFPVRGGKGTCTCAVCAPGFMRNYYGDCIACTGDQAASQCAEYEFNSCRCRKCKQGFGPLTYRRQCPACTNPTASECTEYAEAPAPGPGSLGTCSCKTCADGFKLQTATGDCIPCTAPPNCATPEANLCDGCATCSNGYSLNDATKTCEECTGNPNCNVFQANKCACTTCAPGFEGEACTPCTAPPNCATPEANLCDGCATCSNGYSLNDATKTCEECTGNPNCNVFQANKCACSTCKSNFEGESCTPCEPAHCDTPLTNSCDGCSVCTSGYSLNGAACEDCAKPNCDTFTPNTCDCTCKPGYEGASCDSCINGWQKVGDACEECQGDLHCTTFDTEACTCATCDAGFAPDVNGACVACEGGQAPDVCTYATPGTSCTCDSCVDPDAYMVVDGACVQKATLTVDTPTVDPSDTVTAGAEVTLSVTISNGGTVDAAGVTFAFALPTDPAWSGVTWDVAPSTGTCTLDSGAYTCALGDLAAAGTVTVTITVTPASTFSFVASVAASNVEACTSSCIVSADITVEP